MHAHPDFAAAFSAGIRDGVPPFGVTAGDSAEIPLRFAVYRNNVTVGLVRALEARFPVIARLVGADFFQALARLFAATDLPASPVIAEWGAGFPAFLAGFPPLAGYPYMADVARIELARGRAYHAADAEPVDPSSLITHPAGDLRLRLHPSLCILRLDHPAVTIWAANQPGARPDPVGPVGAEIALVLRDRDFAVTVAAISAADAALIGALLAGEPLLAAATAAQAIDPDHDPQPALLRLMRAGAIVRPEET